MTKKTKAQLKEELTEQAKRYAKLKHGYLDIMELLQEMRTQVKKIVEELEDETSKD